MHPSTSISSWLSSHLDSLHFSTKLAIGISSLVFLLSCFALPIYSFCLIPALLSHWLQWYRLITFPWFHVNFFHIFFNILTFIPLGNSLEKQLGSLQFLHLLFLFSLSSGLLQSLLSLSLSLLSSSLSSSFHGCCAGLSGVIFGLIAIDVHLSPPGSSRRIFLFSIPSPLYPWALLLFIQLLVPQVSFLGHLSGLLIGYLFCWGWMRRFQLPGGLLAKIEANQSFLGACQRVGGFVPHREEGFVLPVFVPPNLSPSGVQNSVQNYLNQLKESWRTPNPLGTQGGPPPPYSPSPPSSSSSPSSPPSSFTSSSSSHTPPSPNHFPGKGHILGSS